MQLFWNLLAGFNLIAVIVTVLVRAYAHRRIAFLSDFDVPADGPWPAVSIVVAARDEQQHLPTGLRSLAEQDYEDYEIIVVDDRSTDDTYRIARDMAARDPRIRVQQVTELPPGWLGKNHALALGARLAAGQFLLFTDADVVLQPDTVRRAMAYVQQHRLDHLTLAPSAEVPTLVLKAFVLLFTNLFMIYTRAWRVADPRSKAHIGIGAFNLVRRSAYAAIGTHRAIAMRPDDDLKLGKCLKQSGFRQQVLNAVDLIRVPWYGSLRELIQGMEKNTFAGVDYSLTMVVGGSLTLLVCYVWPFAAVWLCPGWARWLYAATVLVLLVHAWAAARELKLPARTALLYPLAALLLVYIQWRATLLTFLRGGIQWRGTFYPLAELKRNQL